MTQITQAEKIDNSVTLSPILERNSQIAIQNEDGNEEVAHLAEIGYNADQNATSFRIENSKEVHVGNAVHYNAPVTIYHNVQGEINSELQNEEDETNVTVDGPTEEPYKFSNTGFKQIKIMGIRAIIISLMIGVFILIHNFWPSSDVKCLYKKALKRNTSWSVLNQPSNLLVFKFDENDCNSKELCLTTFEEQWESHICNFWIDTNGNVYEFAGWNLFVPLFQYKTAVFVCLGNKKMTKNLENVAIKLMNSGVKDGKLTKNYKIATMINIAHPDHIEKYVEWEIEISSLKSFFVLDGYLIPHRELEKELNLNYYLIFSNVASTTLFDKTILANVSKSDLETFKLSKK